MRSDNNQFEELTGGGSGFAPHGSYGDPRWNALGDDLPAGVRLAPEPSPQERLNAVMAAQNPLLEAAQPLLRALADMPAELDDAAIVVLHRLLEREVVTFQALCTNAHIKHEHVVAASYALCTALDEAANSTEWGGGIGSDAGVWAAQQLAAQFHGDTRGGDKFFLLIGRLAASPQEHVDLLELMYQILGLGFEGRFSTAANGRRQLETIRHRLLTLLVASRGEVPSDLSPHWAGVGAGKFRLLRSIPVWVTGSVLALVLFGIFAWYKYQLLHISAEVEQHIAAIGKLRAPPVRILRLKELLTAEIERGSVTVQETDWASTVSFKGDDMFAPGQARINAKTLPALAKVAEEIRQVPGTVRILGHSDNQPIRTREFPSNQVLSEKRAQAVAEVLKSKGVEASRLQVEGKGDTVPRAGNQSAAGRSMNRRVDVIVMQGGTGAEVSTVGLAVGDAAAAPSSNVPAPVAAHPSITSSVR